VSIAGAAGERILCAEFTALPGQEAVVAELVAALALQVREEPGNVVFDAHCVADEPGRFFVYEVYADQAAFNAHITASYGAAFNAALASLIVEDGSQLTWLSRV
jgi:quinol monooxygenase YgiN